MPDTTPDPLASLSHEERTATSLALLLRGQAQVIPLTMRALEAQMSRDRAWAELYDTLRQWLTPAGWRELLSTRGGQVLAVALALAGLAATGIAIDLDHLSTVAGQAWSGQCIP